MNTLGGKYQLPLPLAPGVPAPTFASNPYELDANIDGVLTKRTPGGAATLNWDWSGVGFTSISSYQAQDLRDHFDADSSTLDIAQTTYGEHDSQFSQELRATQSTQLVTWLLGLYTDRVSTDRLDQTIYGPDGQFGHLAGGHLNRSVTLNLKTRSYAAFAQLVYSFTDRLGLTVGGRYSRDQKDARYQLTNSAGTLLYVPYELGLPPQAWNSFNPMASLNFKITPDILVYGSYTTGYKSGAFQFSPVTPLAASQVAGPEHVKSYELGVKSELLEKRARVNLSVFDMDYKDLQVSNLTEVDGTLISVISNAAKSRIKGAELESEFVLSRNWRAGVNYSYLDAIYDNYVFTNNINYSGNRLQFAPRGKVDVSIDYEKQLDSAVLSGHVGYSWRSLIYFAPDNNKTYPDLSEGSVGLLDSSVSVKRGAWKLTAWGLNLTDHRYRILAVSAAPYAQREVWAAPRTVGLRVNFETN
jgi:iron complex outermembrane receptor protein